MSCVVAGLRYYFRIYKYEYLGELMTSELHITSYNYLSYNTRRPVFRKSVKLLNYHPHLFKNLKSIV